MINIPNHLTLFRIALVPVLVFAFYLPVPQAHLIAAVLFAVAAVTDWLDGYLARLLGQMTPFGAFLDPVADKLMVIMALVVMVSEVHAFYFTIPAAVIVGRELVISALREWMAELGKRVSVAVTYLGKVKTGVQMVAVLLLLLSVPNFQQGWWALGMVLLYLAAILTLWSMFIYLKAAWSDLTLS